MKKRKTHSPEQIVAKFRDDVMLNTGNDVAVVLPVLEVSEANFYRWRTQDGTRGVTKPSV